MKKLAVALAILTLAACAAVKPSFCTRPVWGDGQTADADDVVVWSALGWALSGGKRSAVAPCGNGLDCWQVRNYVRMLGGEILRVDRCAVYWIPKEGWCGLLLLWPRRKARDQRRLQRGILADLRPAYLVEGPARIGRGEFSQRWMADHAHEPRGTQG